MSTVDQRRKIRRFIAFGVLSAVGLSATYDRCLAVDDPRINTALQKAVAHLLDITPGSGNRGEKSLATLALIKTGHTTDDPRIAALVKTIAGYAANGRYQPDSHHIYVSGIEIMCLANADPAEYEKEIRAIADYLIQEQRPNGSWDYVGRVDGDTSMTQYGILGLWEASQTGTEIDPQIWEKALFWLLSHQDRSGGWCYHPTINAEGAAACDSGNPTHTMTIAGAASVRFCGSRLDLAADDAEEEKKKKQEYALLEPYVDDERADGEGVKKGFKPRMKEEQVDRSLQGGDRWVDANFTIENSLPAEHRLYFLYGLERYASVSGKKVIGGRDWYAAGADYLLARQNANGAFGSIVETAFATMFLGKVTEKAMEKLGISVMRGGALIGGRGLPTEDGDSMAGRQRGRYRHALATPVDKVLEALTSPTDVPLEVPLEEMAAAVETADPKQLIAALEGKLPALRALASHENPEVRRTALAALARSRDLTVVPVLIEALRDKNLYVYQTARDGLRYISRRAEGFGLPQGIPTDTQLQQGMDAWNRWYAHLRIELTPEQEYGK